MYSLVIAEAAMELVPQNLRNHPSVRNHSKRTGRGSNELFLDISYHHKAMVEKNIDQWWKRGRPDIVHFDLVTALSTPLFKQKKLQVYVSTFDNNLVTLSQDLRIPKNYSRFERLMIGIMNKQKSKDSPALIEYQEDVNFNALMEKIVRPDLIIGFSVKGTKSKISDILRNNAIDTSKHYCFVVGGFQRGYFSDIVSEACDVIYSISPLGLESHVVISRILYECENHIQ
ncbi:MAG TPA: ribosome biogenesis protein [Nitrososphaeraceae archaeon]|nr:ribosome biogenesis protein [Nitrososphaeraceae archaeon]